MKVANIINAFFAWISVQDYEDAKDAASRKIVRRQSRGNVKIQDHNGWYMTVDELLTKSRNADSAMRRLRGA